MYLKWIEKSKSNNKGDLNRLWFFILNISSVLKNKIGAKIKKGDIIAEVANYPENGNWAPHLHFQIMLSTLNYKVDFPGVCYYNQVEVWKDLCPNPNLLFKSVDLNYTNDKSDGELI